MTTLSPNVPGLRHSIQAETERGPVVALIFFLTVLPLEWITLTGVGGGFIKPFHLAAVVFIAVCLLRWSPSVLLAPTWHRHLPVFAAYFVVLGVTFASTLAHTDPFLPQVVVLRQLFYTVTAVVMAGCLVLVIGRPVQRWLAWSGVAASGALMAAISYALLPANPLAIVWSALVQQNPDIITFQLLRTAFRTDVGLEDAADNLRHKVFIGLLVAVFLGLACTAIVDRRHRLIRGLLAVGGVVGCALVLLSLSRSTILSLAVPFMLYPLRLLIRDWARPAQAVTLIVAVAAALAAIISPLGQLLLVRFGATGSYSSRLTAAGPTFMENFGDSALLGTTSAAVEKSPHNFVLNAWLGGGIVAGAAATVMLLALAWMWLREVRRYLTDGPGWVVPVEQVWVLGIGVIPLVRAFTAGSQFHMVEFAAIAVFIGITLANERALAAATATKQRAAQGPA